jgi:hypothetical protein
VGAPTPSAAANVAPLRALAAPPPVAMGGAPPVGTAKLELPAAGYPPPPPPVGIAHAPTELAPKPAPSPPTGRSWPQRPEPSEGGQRDTPTEMFVKGVHGPADEAPANGGRPPLPSGAGDRDTPTRAIELPAQRAPLAPTMQSAGAMPEEPPAPESGVVASPGPRFGAPPMDLKAPPGALQTMPISALMVPPMPGQAFGGTPSMPNIEAMPMMGAPAAPPKPGWQLALDRALAGVGRTGNDLAQRFRSAPQNTQIIIVIVSVTALILVLGLLVFLIVR